MRPTIVSYDDIDTQLVEGLPERETLFININVAPVIGVNLAIAINAATINGAANAFATQSLTSVIG
jgi:hypothetical protein